MFPSPVGVRNVHLVTDFPPKSQAFIRETEDMTYCNSPTTPLSFPLHPPSKTCLSTYSNMSFLALGRARRRSILGLLSITSGFPVRLGRRLSEFIDGVYHRVEGLDTNAIPVSSTRVRSTSSTSTCGRLISIGMNSNWQGDHQTARSQPTGCRLRR
jgi:hypothetical protein